ncbi:hypothetical protein E4U41_005453 [Claviceps citrina]|nr:hypothetical protein E4U41_005453 [Claviceps citrina]
MNTTVGESVSLGRDSAAIAQSNGYGNDGWTAISPYSRSSYDGSSMNEYPDFGTFVPHGMPSESIPRMPPPAAAHHQNRHQQQQSIMQHSAPMGHHQLPMLNTTWPSQLTNPTPTSGSFSAPVLLSASPVPRLPPAIETPKLLSQAEKGRKTLTTEQKRRMCQFHEDHPGTRQADIGREFGVERSTVSKVLRHKDQYLKREQEPDPAAVKRGGKTKNPDFDRTLGNYVRRQQQCGFEIEDEDIMEQARLFAHASGNQDAILGNLTCSWLQKFKQKHGVGTDRLLRRASETNIADRNRVADSQSAEKSTTPNELSPASPPHPRSPLSGSRSDEDARREQSMEFGFAYRQQHSQSTTSLASDVRDCAGSSFSGGTLSPTGTFNFSPDPNVGAFQSLAVGHDLPHGYNHGGKRSNTFPSIDIEYANQQAQGTAEPMTPQLPRNMAMSSTAVDPAAGETHHPTSYAVTTELTSPLRIHRNGRASGLTVRTSTTSVETSPVSPTQEDARLAANTLLSYLQNSGQLFQSSDYNAIVQLTKKLEIHPLQNHRLSGGGLSRIPEGDCETTASPGPALKQAI